MKVRSFLAFDIPKDVKARLAKLINDFAGKEKGVRWMKPENMHVTLKFFGDVEEDILLGDIASRVESITAGYGSAKLKCEGVGVFPNWKYPRVIWAGFFGDTEKVVNLQKMVESALSSLGLHEDKREFRLHLTLGRAKGRLKNTPLVKLIEGLGPVKFGDVEVSGIVMYKSVLTKTGAIYTPLKEFGLKTVQN